MSDPRIDRIAACWSAAQTVARVTVDELLADLPDDTYTNVVPLFPDWTAGETVSVGAVRQFDSNLWRVVQAHTTQADWTPDKVPALFKVHRTPEMTEWVAGIDVKAGEKLTYKGATYEVVQSHRTQAGWEPDQVPSLWKKI